MYTVHATSVNRIGQDFTVVFFFFFFFQLKCTFLIGIMLHQHFVSLKKTKLKLTLLLLISSANVVLFVNFMSMVISSFCFALFSNNI